MLGLVTFLTSAYMAINTSPEATVLMVITHS